METPIWVSFAAVWLVTTAVILLSKHLYGSRRLNTPPGPKPWPIIGNFNLIGSLPHRSLHDLSKKYGPIMMLKFGSIPVVVGSSVQMAKLVLKTHDEAFAGRPTTTAGKLTAYNHADITWSQYGAYWRQLRKLCSTELFSVKRLESYEYIRVQELKSIIIDISKCGEKPILLRDILSTLSLNVISRMVLGKRYLDKEESPIILPDEFKKMIDEAFYLNGVLNLGDWIPCLKNFDVQGYVKRMKILSKKFDRFLEHVLDEHNARREIEGQNWCPRDMVDVLLEHAANENHEVKIERDGLKALIQDLIGGGTESSAVTVEWAMSELLKKPEVMVKAREELDHVIGKERWVQETDIQNLPYIRAIAKETMRLHAVAYLLVPRMARKEVQIEGYDIPKGSVVLVNTFTTQRDPNVYERPEEFWPERFIGNNIDVKGHDFELLPFGSGRRMCPGYSLGLKVIEASLANLLHGFTWNLPADMKPKDLNMEEIFGLSNPKKDPLFACAEPRLPPHLYDA